MNERLLQFIWQFQYFNSKELRTTAGESIWVLHPGQYNRHQGPDFLESRIRIEGALWIGNVELHITSSDWHKHEHHHDKNYENVILHVVWLEDGVPVRGIPTLLLQDRTPKVLLQQYELWMHSRSFIPCGGSVSEVSDLVLMAWKDRLLIERIQRKCLLPAKWLSENHYHWEETFWWMLSRNFGLPVNAEAFEEMARSIPVILLSRHRNQIHQLEALFLGQAGLLEVEPKGKPVCKSEGPPKFPHEDRYLIMLQKEYKFFQQKYKLIKINQPVHFLRIRPKAFPTVRLAQLAMLIHQSAKLFSQIRQACSIQEVRELFSVTANDYWHYHFTFKETSSCQPKHLGAQMINNIIINTIVPLLFAYGEFHHDQALKQKGLDWLKTLPGEKNAVTVQFINHGLENQTACDSQSLLELKTQYCDKRRCLECPIGNSLLKRPQ